MANIMMFCLLFLVIIGTQVCAQNNTTAIRFANISDVNATGTPSVTSLGTPSVTVSLKISSSPLPTVVSSVNVPVTPTSVVGTASPIINSIGTVTTTGASNPTPTPSCVVYTESYNRNLTYLKNFRIGVKFTFKTFEYEVDKRSCTTMDKCCEGKGKTTLMLDFKNCDRLNVTDIDCVDATDLCKCRAGFLNASVFITLVGMFLYLVPCN